MILSAYCIYSCYLVKEFIISSLNMSESVKMCMVEGMVAMCNLW